jgi:hypothetical protein
MASLRYFGNTTAGGVLDHTGQYLHVQTAGAIDPNDGDPLCDSEQTYRITPSTGQLRFLGDTTFNQGRFTGVSSPLSIIADDLFTYNTMTDGGCGQMMLSRRYKCG